MGNYTRQFARVTTVLAADVATAGTFTVSYPTGFVQNDFTGGLAVASGHYAIVNDNDRWSASASKMSATFGASTITVTNSSGLTWTAGSTVSLYFDIVDPADVTDLTFYVDLASITAADVITSFYPRVAGTIEYFGFIVDKAVTTASKAATLRPKVGGVAVTGGALALTSANCTPKGTVVDATAITGGNVLTRASAISITGSAVTAFAEGTGTLVLRVRNAAPDFY